MDPGVQGNLHSKLRALSKYHEYHQSEDHFKVGVVTVLGRIWSDRDTNQRKNLKKHVSVFSHYCITEDTMAFYSFPSVKGMTKTGTHEGNRNGIGASIAFFIRAVIGAARSCITISAMSIFDKQNDIILAKLLELLKAKPTLTLKLLIDSASAASTEDNVGVSSLLETIRRVVPEEQISVYTTHQCVNRKDEENRIEIFTCGRHDGKEEKEKGKETPNEDWAFHTKSIVVDDEFMILTTANIKQLGSWGGLTVLNKYYFTRKAAWVHQTIRYLNSYFYFIKASAGK